MTIELPPAIGSYFATDKARDPGRLSDCFTPGATVIDEGNTYQGRDAIRDWVANASTQYSYSVEPFALTQESDRIVVTAHLVGNFPGSPADLRYRFVLDGDRIAELEIVP